MWKVCGRENVTQVLIFEHRNLFTDFAAEFYLLVSVGKKCPENPPGKVQPEVTREKSPTYFCRLAGPKRFQETLTFATEKTYTHFP